MRNGGGIQVLVVAAVVAGSTLVGPGRLPGAAADDTADVGPSGETLAFRCLPDESGTVFVRARSGLVGMVGTGSGAPIPQPAPRSASPEAAARTYFSACGSFFGVDHQADELQTTGSGEVAGGRELVEFQQLFRGIPVFAGELNVLLDSSGDVISVSGETMPRIPVRTVARIDADAARLTARRAVAREHGVARRTLRVPMPELWIYDPFLIGAGSDSPRLAWRLEVSAKDGGPIRHLVFVDARTGRVLLSINQVDTARIRHTFSAENTWDDPFRTLVCDETNPTCSGGDTDAVAAHLGTGETYDFYFTHHGRDSIDDQGKVLISSVHYKSGYCNAFWNGSWMTYGDGCSIVTDDVVAHEITHGVTQHESDLVYYRESGAINESLSDIWGEFVDLTNGRGSDTAADRWLIGEDITAAPWGDGAIRSMKDPTQFDDPDRMSSPHYYTDIYDNGGVHTNSGVGNKAAYLITDGGTFNGYTIEGIGITKAAKIYYEAQTIYLTPGSDYEDLHNYLYQSCLNLVGADGITENDCPQVRNATLATEMAGGAWSTRRSLYSNRAHAAAAGVNGKVYLIGGVTTYDTFDEAVEVYDPATDLWSTGADKPTGVFGARAGVIDGKIYVPGGADDDYTTTANVEVYDPATDTWSTVAPLPIDSEGLVHHSVAAHGSRLFVFGGLRGWDDQDTCFVYDQPTDTWSSCAPMPGARRRAAAAVLNGKIYLIGGAVGVDSYGAPEKLLTEVLEYDPDSDSWRSLDPLPIPRSSAGAVGYGDHLYVCGGRTRTPEYRGNLRSCETYRPPGNAAAFPSGEAIPMTRWHQHSWMKAGRSGLGLVETGDVLFAVGGWEEQGYGFVLSHLNEVMYLPSCRGMTPTVTGTHGNDLLVGTPGDDVIAGFAGRDVIRGRGGNDVICGGPGNDTLIGGSGDDILDGGEGADTVSYPGASGPVSVNLATGRSAGADGTDTLDRVENIAGSAWNDTLTGDRGRNTLRGGGGDDTLTGGVGNDNLDGGDGIDTVSYKRTLSAVTVDLAAGRATGGAGRDRLRRIENIMGSAWGDTLIGNREPNTLWGNDGFDLLIGGGGGDTLDGGGWTDTAHYGTAPGPVTVDLTAGTASGRHGDDRLLNIENVVGSYNYADTLVGDRRDNTFWGFGGDDTLQGLEGDDTLYGGPGTDHADGGPGTDTCRAEIEVSCETRPR